VRGVALVLLVGCSFHVNSSAPIDAPDGSTDAADGSIDAPPIDSPPASATCFGAWCRRKPITVHASKVQGGPHASFPVLVQLAGDAELMAEARSDGHDITFTASDGTTKLAYERVLFTKATGALTVWVNVPSLVSTSDTTLWMYWGNAAASDQQQAAATWSSAFQGVWHLEETSGALQDSTINNNDGAGVMGPLLGQPAKLGNGVRLDGIDDRIRMADSPSLDSTAAAGTLELWLRFTSTASGAYQFIMASSNDFTAPRNSFEWASQSGGDHYFYPWRGDDNDYNLGPNPYGAGGTWHLAAVTFAASTREVKIYVDGLAMGFTVVNVPTLWTTNAQPVDWLWGGHPSVAGWFAGMMDEIRVANVVRSAGWLATEFANQSSPSTFAAIGAAEQLAP
jgi:hypothetical protein